MAPVGSRPPSDQEHHQMSARKIQAGTSTTVFKQERASLNDETARKMARNTTCTGLYTDPKLDSSWYHPDHYPGKSANLQADPWDEDLVLTEYQLCSKLKPFVYTTADRFDDNSSEGFEPEKEQNVGLPQHLSTAFTIPDNWPPVQDLRVYEKTEHYGHDDDHDYDYAYNLKSYLPTISIQDDRAPQKPCLDTVISSGPQKDVPQSSCAASAHMMSEVLAKDQLPPIPPLKGPRLSGDWEKSCTVTKVEGDFVLVQDVLVPITMGSEDGFVYVAECTWEDI